MGIMEDIGKTMANWTKTLAEWIGDAIEKVIKAVLAILPVQAEKMAGEVRKYMTTPEDNTTGLGGDVAEKMNQYLGAMAAQAIAEIQDPVTPLPPSKAITKVTKLHDELSKKIDNVCLKSSIISGASFGLLDFPWTFMQWIDTVYGTSRLAGEIQRIKHEIAYLQPYQQALNRIHLHTIPSPQDLITFLVREAFDPERLPVLLEGYPGTDFEEPMKLHGYAPSWSKFYWAAHWRLPSVGDLNEMLYRGNIDMNTWKKYMQYNDYIPEMIPQYNKIIYKPYTRVDVRRMYKAGVIDRDEVKKNYKWLGYDDEHAELLTQWVEKSYSEFEEGLKRSDCDERLRYGVWTIAQYKEALPKVGVPPDMVDSETTTMLRRIGVSQIQENYALGFISGTEAQKQLKECGYTGARADRIMKGDSEREVLSDILDGLRQPGTRPPYAIPGISKTVGEQLMALGYETISQFIAGDAETIAEQIGKKADWVARMQAIGTGML